MLDVRYADREGGVANVILEPLTTCLVRQPQAQDVFVELACRFDVTHRVGQKSDGLNHSGVVGRTFMSPSKLMPYWDHGRSVIFAFPLGPEVITQGTQPILIMPKASRSEGAGILVDTGKAKPDQSTVLCRRNSTMHPFTSAAAGLVSLIVAASASAAEPLVVEIWPGKVPDESGNIGAERFRMSPALDRKQVEVTEPTRMITDVTKPTLTLYRPPKEQDSGTAMLICPGGGYWNLYWQLEGEEVAAWLNSLGVTGIILKYRVPRRPDEPQGEPARRPLADAQRAVSLVRSRAGEWGINPERIGIVGFSAGGHLAIATATSFDKRTYEPIDDIDKISCRPDFAIPVYSGYLKVKDKDELAPGLRIPTGTPPVFLAHGGDDIISPPEHSVLMYLALKRAGVPAELHIYATAAHDFGVRKSDHPCSTWTESCANWLRHQGFLKPTTRP
jgi:acetyl esterase/lipase